jgi:hypothetical protein
MHKYEVDGYFFDEPKPVQEGMSHFGTLTTCPG